MLEEAVDEAIHGGGAGLEQACIGSAILESDLRSLRAAVIGELYQATIADGDTIDVRGQVFDGRLSITDRLAVDDPILEPDLWRYPSKGGRLFEEVEEFGTEEFGKGFDRQEEIIVRGQPGLLIWGDTAARDKVVDMGVVGQVTGPGVEHVDHTDLTSNVTGIFGLFLCCFCRSLEEGVVDEFLVSAGNLPQAFWEGEGQKEVRRWQE